MSKIVTFLVLTAVIISGCTPKVEKNDSNKSDDKMAQVTDTRQERDCGISTTIAEEIPLNQVSFDDDQAMDCLGRALAENCHPSRVTMKTWNSGDLNFIVKGGDEIVCNVVFEYGDEDQINLDGQKQFANKSFECPFPMINLIKMITSSQNPGEVSGGVWFLTAMQLLNDIESDNPVCRTI